MIDSERLEDHFDPNTHMIATKPSTALSEGLTGVFSITTVNDDKNRDDTRWAVVEMTLDSEELTELFDRREII